MCKTIRMNKRQILAIFVFMIWAVLLISWHFEQYIYLFLDNIGWMVVAAVIMTRLSGKQFGLAGYILVRICILLSVVAAGIQMWHGGYKEVKEKLTGRCFVARYESNMLKKGSITYYEKTGIFLHSPKETSAKEICLDQPFFCVDSEDIYVTVEFGGGATFPFDKNDKLNFNEILKHEFRLRRETYDFLESYTINDKEIRYYRSDTKQEKKIVIDKVQFQQITDTVKAAKLASMSDRKETDIFEYELKVESANGDTEIIYINGAEAFEVIENLIRE